MFKGALETIVAHTDGAIGALIMGTDGIAVEKALGAEGEDANLDVAAATFTSLVKSTQRMGGETGLGDPREIVVTLARTVLVIRLLSQEYFVVLGIRPDGNVGRGRYELRKAELELAREFTL